MVGGLEEQQQPLQTTAPSSPNLRRQLRRRLSKRFSFRATNSSRELQQKQQQRAEQQLAANKSPPCRSATDSTQNSTGSETSCSSNNNNNNDDDITDYGYGSAAPAPPSPLRTLVRRLSCSSMCCNSDAIEDNVLLSPARDAPAPTRCPLRRTNSARGMLQRPTSGSTNKQTEQNNEPSTEPTPKSIYRLRRSSLQTGLSLSLHGTSSSRTKTRSKRNLFEKKEGLSATFHATTSCGNSNAPLRRSSSTRDLLLLAIENEARDAATPKSRRRAGRRSSCHDLSLFSSHHYNKNQKGLSLSSHDNTSSHGTTITTTTTSATTTSNKRTSEMSGAGGRENGSLRRLFRRSDSMPAIFSQKSFCRRGRNNKNNNNRIISNKQHGDEDPSEATTHFGLDYTVTSSEDDDLATLLKDVDEALLAVAQHKVAVLDELSSNLDLAVARYVSGNTMGAVLSMRKAHKYKTTSAYVAATHLQLVALQQQVEAEWKRQDANPYCYFVKENDKLVQGRNVVRSKANRRASIGSSSSSSVMNTTEQRQKMKSLMALSEKAPPVMPSDQALLQQLSSLMSTRRTSTTIPTTALLLRQNSTERVCELARQHAA